ncbi:MAG: hypothetical protein LQ341_005336 [Variospora aurantia]|nr:MAG: hypothetical protein LQ341_005336 [Variospora aurantia]
MSSQTELLQSLWLLLLPAPPLDITLSNVKDIYASTISQVLQKAAEISASSSIVTILDVALPCPKISTSKTHHYAYTQNLLRQMYSLVCLQCTEHSIDVRYCNDVDVRVLLFQSPDPARSETSPDSVENSPFVGPMVTLQRLASCARPWQRLCAMDNDGGEVLLQTFLRLRNPSLEDARDKVVIERFIPERSPHVSSSNRTRNGIDNGKPRACHDAVAVGGTFDHLHIGHKLLLSMTALVTSPVIPTGSTQRRSITVGITGDRLLENKKYREHLQDWRQRQSAVQAFLSAFLVLDAPPQRISTDNSDDRKGTQERAVKDSWSSGLTIEYVEIFDAFGPTITDESITALVLSRETRAGGETVNEKRAEKGWPALDIFEVDVLDASEDDASSEEAHDFQNKISSTQIRRRLGDRSGTADQGQSSDVDVV